MKNGSLIRSKNNACPAILSGMHSGANENTSEQECIPESGRMFVPLFTERRLLCAVRERRQGNPPLIAHDGPRIGLKCALTRSQFDAYFQGALFAAGFAVYKWHFKRARDIPEDFDLDCAAWRHDLLNFLYRVARPPWSKDQFNDKR